MLGWLDGLRRWIRTLATPMVAAETPPPPHSETPLAPEAGAASSGTPGAEAPSAALSFRKHPGRALLAFITGSRTLFLAVLALWFLLIYFGLGALVISRVDDNPAFRPAEADLPPGGSVAVAMTSALIDREVNGHGWVPDDPFFYPTALLDNMPAFQRGIRMAAYRFVTALATRQPTDEDLQEAQEALSVRPDRWWVGTDWPWLRAPAGSRYDDAVDFIRAYNTRIAEGSAPWVRDAPTLALLLEHLANALSEGEQALERHMTGGETIPGKRLGNDEIFYAIRGEAYASLLILSGLREDFAPLIRERELSAEWASVARSLETAVNINPLVVTVGDPGSLLVKNHLMEQGFAVQRARQRLLALAATLRKGK